MNAILPDEISIDISTNDAIFDTTFDSYDEAAAYKELFQIEDVVIRKNEHNKYKLVKVINVLDWDNKQIVAGDTLTHWIFGKVRLLGIYDDQSYRIIVLKKWFIQYNIRMWRPSVPSGKTRLMDYSLSKITLSDVLNQIIISYDNLNSRNRVLVDTIMIAVVSLVLDVVLSYLIPELTEIIPEIVC